MQHDARKRAKSIIIIIIFLFFVTLQVRFLEDRGSSEVKASQLYIYSGIASLLVRPVIGRVNDLTWVNPCYIYTVAAALEGVFTILLPFASTQFHFVIYFVFYGLADGTVGCGINIAILNGLPERLKPLGFGTYNCLSCITSACGPALGGIYFQNELCSF